MEFLPQIYFGVFAVLSLLCALTLLFTRHPINGAMGLIGLMISLSGIYAVLHAPFMAVLQVLVYASAIAMLLVFVIMILNAAKDRETLRFGPLGIILLVVPALLAALLTHTYRGASLSFSEAAIRGTAHNTGAMLFGPTGYVLLFEAIALVLMVAVVGAVLLAKHDLDSSHKEKKA